MVPKLALFLVLLVIDTLRTEGSEEYYVPRNKENPVEPEEVGVCMANGIFDPNDPDFTPPTYDFFSENIMGRVTHESKDKRRAEVVDYFLERFGVDFSGGDVSLDGKFALGNAYTDPRWNYRCYKVPGRNSAPSSGMILHDGTWGMQALVDATLFGSWGGDGGTHVPANSVAVDGEYVIQGTQKFRLNSERNIYLRFQSVSPIFPQPNGIKFDCVLFSDRFGMGAAIGRQEQYVLDNGMVQIAVQNVIQFPAPDWAKA